jgi:hypothetical protein
VRYVTYIYIYIYIFIFIFIYVVSRLRVKWCSETVHSLVIIKEYCECCALSGRGLCVWPITRPEDILSVLRPTGVITKPRKWRP